jgi:hypothetical protein
VSRNWHWDWTADCLFILSPTKLRSDIKCFCPSVCRQILCRTITWVVFLRIFYNFIRNASCNCGTPCENSHHFFFDCDKYTDNREILFYSLNWLPSNINIDVKLLTKGSDFLKYQENTTIFKHIKDSKRFTIV